MQPVTYYKTLRVFYNNRLVKSTFLNMSITAYQAITVYVIIKRLYLI